MSSTVGRYAPSPSGRMHLGNLCCCLLAWLSAKSSGGKVVLRIEDLDAVRCPREFADLLEADLAWLGLAADEGGSKGGPRGPYYQSECADIYTASYEKLAAQPSIYSRDNLVLHRHGNQYPVRPYCPPPQKAWRHEPLSA